MPHLIDTGTRVDALVAAMNELLITDGIPGLSLRKIAAVSGVSTGSTVHHLGGKGRLLSLAAGLTARSLRSDIEARRWTEGVLAFLPNDDDGVLTTRAWLAWLELGRSEPLLEPSINGAVERERLLLAATLDHRLARDELDLLSASIDGLRGAVSAPVRPMPPHRARTLLARQLRALGVEISPPESGRAAS